MTINQKYRRKNYLVWICVWFICVYLNGLDDAFAIKADILKNLLGALFLGTGIFCNDPH